MKKVDFEEIVKTILYITKGVDSNQPRLLSRSIRQNASIRKYVTTAQLANLVKKYVPVDWPTVSVMNDLLGKLNNCPQVVREAAEVRAIQRYCVAKEKTESSFLVFSFPCSLFRLVLPKHVSMK